MRKWTKQPPAGTPIDLSNPITEGLVFAFNGAEPTQELTKGITATTMNTGTVGGWQTFKGPSGESSSTLIEFTNPFDASADFNTDATVLSVYKPHNRFTISNIGLTFFTGADVNYPMLRLGWDDSGTENAQFRVSTAAGSTRTIIDSPTGSVPNGKLATTVGVCRGDGTNSLTAEIWNNGALLAGPTNLTLQTQAITGASLDDSATVLGDNHLQDRGACVDLFLSCCWNRSLTHAEIKSLSTNPWQIFKPRLSFALADPLPDTRVLTAPIIATPGRFSMYQDGNANTNYYTTVLGSSWQDEWQMFGIWAKKDTQGQFDDILTVADGGGSPYWALQTADTTSPHDIHYWSTLLGYQCISTNDFMTPGEWFYYFGLIYIDKAGGASPDHRMRLTILDSTGTVIHNVSAAPSGNASSYSMDTTRLGIGDWNPVHTANDEPWGGGLFNLKWWGGDAAIGGLWDQGDTIVDFVRREAFNYKPQWHPDTCLWYPLDNKWMHRSPWGHVRDLTIATNAPEHNASGFPTMKKSSDLQVPIEYQELTFDDDAEERLFIIPQGAKKQP